MKKVLLVLLAVGVMISAYAQNRTGVLRTPGKMAVQGLVDIKELPLIPMNPPSPVMMKGAVTTMPIGTSANIYNNITSVTNLTTYHWDVDVIGFNHRAGGLWGGASGDIRWKFTTDYGVTWDSLIFTHPGSNNFRYPNISMVNPAGNTTPANAFGVVNGPCTDGSGWVNNYFATQRLDKTLTDIQLQAIPADTQNLCLQNSTWCDGGVVYNSQDHSLTAGGAQFFTVNKGTFDFGTNVMTWTQSPRIKHLFKNRIFSNATSAWSFNNNFAAAQDNSILYFFCYGKDSLNNPLDLAIPHVWASWDGGATFGKIGTDIMTDNPGLRQWIWPTLASWGTASEVYRPMFMCGSTAEESNYPGVVDANGDLHLMCVVEGAYSSHVDSLDYSYTNHPRYIFDVVYRGGEWNALLIDTLAVDVILPDNTGFGVGTDAVGWDHDFHVGIDETGEKVFFTWTDTDPLSGDTVNSMPDIKGFSYDVNTLMGTPIKNFTSPDGIFYFMNCAGKVKTEANLFKIPTFYVDIWESGDPLSSQTHYFVDGVEFDVAEYTVQYSFPAYTGSSKNPLADNFVSQNYPNPFNGTTTIKVTLDNASDVNVVITNLVGQEVYNSTSHMSVGIHDIVLGSNLNSGVYFYTVTAGTKSATRKMIVE